MKSIFYVVEYIYDNKLEEVDTMCGWVHVHHDCPAEIEEKIFWAIDDEEIDRNLVLKMMYSVEDKGYVAEYYSGKLYERTEV